MKYDDTSVVSNETMLARIRLEFRSKTFFIDFCASLCMSTYVMMLLNFILCSYRHVSEYIRALDNTKLTSRLMSIFSLLPQPTLPDGNYTRKSACF